MCNRGDLLVSYVYDEISERDRRDVEAHLATCAECRDDIDGLRSTRGHLALWAPPQPELGFRIISGAAAPAPIPALPRRRMAASIAFAAAAVLVLAAAVSVANIEVTYGNGGQVTVRTGWGRAAPQESVAGPGVAASVQPAATAFAELNRRLTEIEQVLADVQGGPTVQNASAGRLSDGEILRQVRAMVRDAESRQQTAVAQQLLQVMRDLDSQRRSDLQAIQRGLGQYQGLTNAQFESTREQINQLYIRANSKQER